MNREIKFRAWDSQALAMSNTFEPLKHEEPKVYDEYVNNSYAIYMQYTGLKDKNGVEIYEGDILRREDGVQKVVFYNEKQGSYYVKFATGGGFVDNIIYPLERGGVVIGNIYENPELSK